MKKITCILFLLICVIACTDAGKVKNTTISGTISGLKKGTLYLQRIDDTLLIDIDSIVIDGNADFVMQAEIKEPEVLYLFLNKKDGAEFNDRISFFAEKGKVVINTRLNAFEQDAKIIAGKNQEKFQEYKDNKRKYDTKNLKLIKDDYQARKQDNEEAILANDKKYQSLLKSRYLYTINFAINNKNLEVAPYLALHEIYDANLKFLDTIANSLKPKIKKSMYGKQFLQHIEDRKIKEDSTYQK